MSKLKNINLGDLGIKVENTNLTQKLKKTINPSLEMEQIFDAEHQLPYRSEEKMLPERRHFKERINNFSTMNNKFLKYVNIIKDIKDKPGQYLDKRAE